MLACVRRESPPAHDEQAADDPSAPPVRSPRTTRIDIPQVTDALVYDTFHRWLQAQNDNDFAAYSALYADRFTGVRRTNVGLHFLTRAGWLAQNERVGRTAPRVAENPQFELGIASASIRFDQKPATSTDTGTAKQLVLELQEDTLRITREVTLVADAPTETANSALPVRIIVNVGAVPYLVVGSGGTTNAPKLMAREGAYAAVGELTDSEAFASWSGKAFKVLTSTGTWCPALGQEVVALVRTVPPASEVAAWRRQRLSDRAISKLLFRSSSAVTAVRLATAPTLNCKGEWLLAQDDKRPIPNVALALNDADLVSAAESAFRHLPGYQQLKLEQRSLRADTAAAGRPDDQLTVSAFDDTHSGQRLLWVKPAVSSICAGFDGHLSVLFDAGKRDAPAMNAPLDTPLKTAIAQADSLLALLDVEGNGAFGALFTEVVSGDTVLVNDQGQTLQRVPANTKANPCILHTSTQH